MVWVDRTGAAEPLPLPSAQYMHPRFSPDGTRLAYAAGPLGNMDIWVYDIELEVQVRLTTVGETTAPVWSPDGTRLAFSSTREGGPFQLFWMAADGSGEPQRLAESDATQWASSWSLDGVLAFLQDYRDIWTVSVDGGSDPEPFLESTQGEQLWYPAFSPNGRWLAYTSNETGRCGDDGRASGGL